MKNRIEIMTKSSTSSLNIVTLDCAMKKALSSDLKKKALRKRLKGLKELQKKSYNSSSPEWKEAIDNVQNHLKKLKEDCSLQMYLVESAEIIDSYKRILEAPMKVSFMGPNTECVETKREKDKLTQDYLSIYEKYRKIASDSIPEPTFDGKSTTTRCINSSCDSVKFNTINETLVCEKCSSVQNTPQSTTSYSDIDRINVSSRYLYDRKVHFRDCILQFQGRQNVTIDKSVYDRLESEFDKHHLLIGDKHTPNSIRFSKITKEHISMFLKELRLAKHYENVQLIHFNLTGIAPPDISRLEGVLLSDFEQLTILYDDIYRNEARKNFINTQYTLFQLLKRHKYPCDVSDFSIIKTSERRDWHHRVCKNLFSILNWNFTSV